MFDLSLQSGVQEEAMNLSYKKDTVQDAKFSEDQCKAGNVVVMELIVKKLDKLFEYLVTSKKASKISVVDMIMRY